MVWQLYLQHVRKQNFSFHEENIFNNIHRGTQISQKLGYVKLIRGHPLVTNDIRIIHATHNKIDATILSSMTEKSQVQTTLTVL